MKKKLPLLLTGLIMSLLSPPPILADNVTPYHVDFSETINTSDHNFRVSAGWGHKAESFESEDMSYGGWGSSETVWVKYYQYTNNGVDNSACLKIGSQTLTGSDYDMSSGPVNDLLITPKVSGTISLMVKGNSAKSNIKFFTVSDAGVMDLDNPVKTQNPGTSDYEEVTFTLDAATKLGIRADDVYIDDFKATSAEVEYIKELSFVSVNPSYDPYYFFEDENGNAYYKNSSGVRGFKIKVKNTGDVDIAADAENFSLVLSKEDGTPLGNPVTITQALAKGATSDEIILDPEFPVSSFWANSSDRPSIYLKENLTGKVIKKLGTAPYYTYEAKFTFREGSGYGTSSLSADQAFGLVSGEASRNYEIYNDGIAPLIITNVTLDNGFTTDLTETAFTVASKEKKLFTIKAPATVGTHNATLTITYKIKDGVDEQTYTLPFSANVLDANTWRADFNNTSSSIVYPEGSIAQDGINSGYIYGKDKYNNYIKSYKNSDYQTANNMFITPKLTAEANETMSFDVAYDSDGYDHFVKVYFSEDRVNWGEPVETITLESSDNNFATRTVTATTAGERYVGFAVHGARLDNIAGFKKVDVKHDIIENKFSTEYKKTDADGNVYNGEVEYTFEILPVLGETADGYTLNFCMEANGDKATTAITPTNMPASAKTYKTIKVKHASDYEATTDVKVYLEYSFTDGTTLKTTEHEFKVLVQPVFKFIKASAATVNEPNNESNAIAFGKVNANTVNKEYIIFNWGNAPLKVKSISVPAGFSVNITSEATVQSKERLPLEITFAPDNTGSFSGNLEIVYTNAEGTDENFSLPISGTMLDQSKWYASFDNESHSSDGAWPAGVVYESSVQLYNTSYSKPDVVATTYSSTNNWFFTPSLEAKAGDVLTFAAAKNGSSRTPSLKVYAAATREDLKDEAKRTEVCSTGELNETMTEYSTSALDAGTWYFGFQLDAYAMVNDVYGLSVPEGYHDIQIVSSAVPTSMMQNIAAAGSLQLRNFGVAPETDYEIVVHVGDDSFTVAAPKEIPTVNKPDAAATELPIELRWPVAGTFDVYYEFRTDNYSKETTPVSVTIAEEVPQGEAVVGTTSTFDNKVPVKYNYGHTETVMLFTPEQLGLAAGTKITSLSFKGYNTSTSTSRNSDIKIYYEFTNETTLTKPESSGAFDPAGLNLALDEKNHVWVKQGTKEVPVNLIEAIFSEPVVYEAGKSLKLVVLSYSAGSSSPWPNPGYFEVTSSADNCWTRSNDNPKVDDLTTPPALTASWSTGTLPVLHIGYAVEPVTVTGNVKYGSNNQNVEGATVTFISEDGDNVRYSGTTDASGNYSIKVVQTGRTYSVEAEKEGLMDVVTDVTISTEAGATNTVNLSLGNIVVLDEDAAVSNVTAAKVVVDIQRQAGFNGVVFPVELSTSEIQSIFGSDVEIYEFAGMVAGDETTVSFKPTEKTTIPAGTPFLVKSSQISKKVVFDAKDVLSTVNPVQKGNATFTGTFSATTLAAGSHHVTDANWQEYEAPQPELFSARLAKDVRPFTAYMQVDPAVDAIRFVTDASVPTGVDEILDGTIGEDDVIYDLNGLRVKNPTPGIYIVNGKKTRIRR